MMKKGEMPESFSSFMKNAKFGKGGGGGGGKPRFGKRLKRGRHARSRGKGRAKIQAEALSQAAEENEVNSPG